MNPLSLFSAYGIELEYMIVDNDTLSVKAIADELIKDVNGTYSGEVENEHIDWSNELALHLIELKHHRPRKDVALTAPLFHHEVTRINSLLKSHNACLMPTAMHPWMNPDHETKLWPHDNKTVYNTFNRVFDCSGHGWSNLQSTHINFAFSNDEEFKHLHSAIRLVLPLIPAWTASSPFVEGQNRNNVLDQRLQFYLANQKRIPSIIGPVVPEYVESQSEYENTILKRMYDDIAPFDTEKELQYEWLNSRAAIPKFERMALEIRAMDIQECPTMDLAWVDFIIQTTKWMTHVLMKHGELLDAQKEMHSENLRELFIESSKKGLKAESSYSLFNQIWTGSPNNQSLRYISYQILDQVAGSMSKGNQQLIRQVLKTGNLSERILAACEGNHDSANLQKIYRELCQCLSDDQPFRLKGEDQSARGK